MQTYLNIIYVEAKKRATRFQETESLFSIKVHFLKMISCVFLLTYIISIVILVSVYTYMHVCVRQQTCACPHCHPSANVHSNDLYLSTQTSICSCVYLVYGRMWSNQDVMA